jgi:hypothetical protein
MAWQAESLLDRRAMMQPPAMSGRGLVVRVGRRRALDQAPEPPQVIEDRVQAMALDEWHGVIVHAPEFAHAVDRDDVAVVEPPGRSRLEPEPLDLGGGQPGLSSVAPFGARRTFPDRL